MGMKKLLYFLSAILLFGLAVQPTQADELVAVPTNLTVIDQSAHSLTLTWETDCTDCKFRLQYGEAADLSDATTISAIMNPQKTLQDLTANTHYYFSVIAYRDEVSSDGTDIGDSWTLPAKVKNVSVTRSDRFAEQVTITWDAQTDVTNYRLRIYNQANDELVYKKTLSAAKEQATVSLGTGKTYYVHVAAIHRNRVGAYSPAVSFKTRSYESSQSIWNTTTNCLEAADSATNSRCWLLGDATLTGNITVSNDVYTLKETDATRTSYMQDIDLGDINDKYLLFVAKTYAEAVGNDHTNLPYLYGYQMDTPNHIVDYFQDTTALFGGEAKTWDVSYEIEPVQDDLDRIRLFLEQASRSGVEQTGSAGKFKFVGFFIVNSEADAQAIINEYKETL